ncbi:alpha/beta fold hydrolase [Synechococcus sp. RSCCF101]|uniref:alpha/beta fold hydrolase n=1 Tax=Synechococcus sp. RSCCF101 TaxID=2511069 RepID=UPI00351A950D
MESASFRQALPWLGPDLQTLRDSLSPEAPWEASRGLRRSSLLAIPVPATPWQVGGALLAHWDRPAGPTRAVVLLLHGLGGCSRRRGVRRLASRLLERGCAVLRLNLRGAGEGRGLIAGSYAARCSEDLAPVLAEARRIATHLGRDAGGSPLPLLGAGLSLGGTILIHACLDLKGNRGPVLDGLVCASSPLDLERCSRSIERPRNGLYQAWLLERLKRQALSDAGDSPPERAIRSLGSIRAFDALITAPRWGHATVAEYYRRASPLRRLQREEPAALPPLLVLQARDDPWVPADGAAELQDLQAKQGLPALEVVISDRGGITASIHRRDAGPMPRWWRGWSAI